MSQSFTMHGVPQIGFVDPSSPFTTTNHIPQNNLHVIGNSVIPDNLEQAVVLNGITPAQTFTPNVIQPVNPFNAFTQQYVAPQYVMPQIEVTKTYACNGLNVRITGQECDVDRAIAILTEKNQVNTTIIATNKNNNGVELNGVRYYKIT